MKFEIIIIIIIIINEFHRDASLTKTSGPLCVSVSLVSMVLLPVVCDCALPYDLRNSSVFSARLNASSDDSDVIAGGSMFQTFAAATGKARSPMVLCNDRGTCSLAHAMVELLQKETPEFIPPQLWPPNLPDLNPVDNSMWEILQEKVYKNASLLWNYQRRY